MRKNVERKLDRLKNICGVCGLNKVMQSRVESVLETCGKITNYA